MVDKLIEFLISIIKLFRFCTIIYPYQAGVLVRLGKFHHVLRPGIRFFFPFGIDRPISENVVLETMFVGPQSLTTRDDKKIVISAVVTFRISDVKTFLLDVEGRNHIIEDSTYGSIAEFIMSRNWAELHDGGIGKELTSIVADYARAYGVNVISVKIADFTSCSSLRLLDRTAKTPLGDKQ